METGRLSKFIVIKSCSFYSNVSYDKDDFANFREATSVFADTVKIEVERAKVNARYVNLRFCHSNRYWARNDDSFIKAESKKPEEDTAKDSCTLFEKVDVDDDDDREMFYLIHIASGGYLKCDPQSMRIFVEHSISPSAFNYFIFVDWETLVKLPKQVAFKGYNGKYLQTIWRDWSDMGRRPFLQFGASEPNAVNTSYDVALLPDGHVRIYSRESTRYWRRDNSIKSSGWIWADADDNSAADPETIFWPVKIDDTTIALRNIGNNNFCTILSSYDITDCLDASSPTIINNANHTVEELVSSRSIRNVRYRLEDARIYNETPFVAGTTSVTNLGDTEATMGVEVTYEDSKSHSFSRSISLGGRVSTTITAGIPLISDTIDVTFEVNTTMEWNKSTTTTTSVKSTGSVPVPPRTLATISYVGVTGTCDVPFSYTQRDVISTDGTVVESDEIDGVFRGVNSYNFAFVIDKTQPVD